jgi:3-methylcrotonyl-CoA carboxylase alpha subunit
MQRWRVHLQADRVEVHDGIRRFAFEQPPVFAPAAATTADSDRVLAPMPGRIVLVRTRVGAEVAAGDELLVMEAMKMELALKAPRAGTIAAVGIDVGDFVEADAVLVRFADAP